MVLVLFAWLYISLLIYFLFPFFMLLIALFFPDALQWLLGAYNTQILLMVFLAIVSLSLAGFFGYHAKLCLTNTTTNEVSLSLSLTLLNSYVLI